jgi:outer membrane protein assembly factor BamB
MKTRVALAAALGCVCGAVLPGGLASGADGGAPSEAVAAAPALIYRGYCMPGGTPQGTGGIEDPHYRGPQGPTVIEKWALFLPGRMPTPTSDKLAFELAQIRPVLLMVDERIYISYYGTLYCIDPQTGKELWHREDRQGFPAIVDNTLYIATAKTMLAEEVESGKEKWHFEVPGRPCQKLSKYAKGVSPLVTEDAVYFEPSTSWEDPAPPPLYALDRGTGKLLWQFSHPTGLSGEPVFGLDTVYVPIHATLPPDGKMTARTYSPNKDACVVALDPRTGAEKWRTKTGMPIRGLAVDLKRQALYGFAHKDEFLILDAATGDIEKTFGAETPRGGKSRFVFGRVGFWGKWAYAGGHGAPLRAMDVEEGKEAWAFMPEKYGACYSFALADGVAYLGSMSRDYDVYGVDAATGNQRWVFRPTLPPTDDAKWWLRHYLWSVPLPWKGVLYYQDHIGIVRALADAPSDGGEAGKEQGQ